MSDRERTIEEIMENFRYWKEKKKVADVWNSLFQCEFLDKCPKALTYECNDGTRQCNRLMSNFKREECPHGK